MLQGTADAHQTKAGIVEHLRQLLIRNLWKEIRDGADFDFLVGLIARHPRSEEKIGSGIAAFEPVLRRGAVTIGLDVLRTDGSRIDVSLKKCIHRQRPFERERNALRSAVRRDIEAFRNAHIAKHAMGGLVRCGYSGRLIAPEDGNVDHAWPRTFARISNDFLRMKGLTLADIRVVELPGRPEVKLMEDRALAEEFRVYHARHAKLRFICRRLNTIIADQNPRPVLRALRRKERAQQRALNGCSGNTEVAELL